MKEINKKALKIGLAAGFATAISMSVFDYEEGQETNYLHYALLFLFFGLFTGLSSRYQLKKRLKEDQNNK